MKKKAYEYGWVPGGLMRCCEQTLADTEMEEPRDFDVLPCSYCSSSMIYYGGAWRWNKKAALKGEEG